MFELHKLNFEKTLIDILNDIYESYKYNFINNVRHLGNKICITLVK